MRLLGRDAEPGLEYATDEEKTELKVYVMTIARGALTLLLALA